MKTVRADVLILGAGFSGSLLGWLLAKSGRQVVIADRLRHPRFAIGESSTPLADLALRLLAEKYELPELAALSHYGSWKESFQNLRCGLKRGFSYFRQPVGEEFHPGDDHGQELLVAASLNDAIGDTHWLRADVDQWFAGKAAEAGTQVWEAADLHVTGRSPWVWSGTINGGERAVTVTADFVVDGTGPAAVIPKLLGLGDETERLKTHSRSVFTHVRGLRRMGDWFDSQGVSRAEHTFDCDHAALHQLLDEGWMWQLRFDHGVTSVGFVIESPDQPTGSPEEQAAWFLDRYPTLKWQFADTEVVDPPGRWLSTGRLQRLWSTAAGEDWALLPHTAGFIDPMHSTGIGQSLFGVESLAELLGREMSPSERQAGLVAYSQRVPAEIRAIDGYVAACYAARQQMPAFVAAVMLYFAAVTTCERRRLRDEPTTFLATDDRELTGTLTEAASRIIEARPRTRAEADELVAMVRSAIRPWNTARLLEPAIANMYSYTALPADT
ncbi:MAG: tryptophan 7-halogenase [Planctomycetaceae bacterium]|nr:tryptophan 7-halogenase [Planctomycetaceae bacterium]